MTDAAADQPAEPCQIIVFPFWARIGRVRLVAHDLIEQSAAGKDSTKYWRALTNSIDKHLASLGCSDVEIGVHIRCFHHAVQKEVDRRMASKRATVPQTQPDGAA